MASDTPLTWGTICTLDEAALNAAIDTYIYHYVWHPVQHGDGDWCEWWQCTDGPDAVVTRSSVPYFRHTASWERSMVLLWAQHVSLSVTNVPGTWVLWADKLTDAPPMHATTEAEARTAICRLALWRAVQAQEEPYA